ncbi:MAG: hypothetical protein ACK5N8_07880, partial [Alphaproteobacteria bacterium]
MNRKSICSSLLTLSMLLLGARSVVAYEPISTLSKLRENIQAYSPETPFSLIEKYADGYIEVKINGTNYYFMPEDDALATKIASTPAGNLIPTIQEDADFEYDGNYFAFDSNAIPPSGYDIVATSSEDKHFSISKLDENDVLVEEFYKIVLSDGEGVAYINNVQDISIHETAENDINTITINLPNNDTKYFQYAYGPRDERPTLNIRQDSLVGNIDSDFVGISYQKSNPLGYSDCNGLFSCGGAISISNIDVIDSITGSFIENNTLSDAYEAHGGAIENRGIINNLNGHFIQNYASSNNAAYGGAIYNNVNSTIGNITGDFIGNYVSSTSSNAQGGAIYNESSSIINTITGDFIGNYASSTSSDASGGAIYNNDKGILNLATTEAKRSILFEDNKVIFFVGSENEIKKLNSITFSGSSYKIIYKSGSEDVIYEGQSGDAIINFDTIANSSINVRDPLSSKLFYTISDSVNGIYENNTYTGADAKTGIINMSGAGSMYLWGDNSEYGGEINIYEGDFAALFEEAQDYINDPLGQRTNFSLANATINFADGTTFRPMVTDNKIANLGGTVITG